MRVPGTSTIRSRRQVRVRARRLGATAAGLALAGALVGAGLVPAQAGDEQGPLDKASKVTAQPEQDLPSAVPERDRVRVLPEDWKTSGDVAWATVGDSTGFHILTATAASSYAWGVTATLVEPGFDADEWIGNACVTSSGRYAVVVYAPRSFVNDPDLFDRGGLAAVVDLETGETTKLDLTASLAYFNPGCGADDRAVVTAARADDDAGDTRLVTINADTGRIDHTVMLEGQVTSAIPLSDTVSVAATGTFVSRVGPDGEVVPLAAAGSVPYSLMFDGEGGLNFLAAPPPGDGETSPEERTGRSDDDAVVASRLSGFQLRSTPGRQLHRAGVFARGSRYGMGLVPSVGGRVALVGDSDVVDDLPPGVSRQPEVDSGVRVGGSTRGTVFVSEVGWNDQAAVQDEFADPELPRQARLTMQIPATGTTLELGTVLDAGATDADTSDEAERADQAPAALTTGGALSPALGEVAISAMVAEDLADGPGERACGVTRGDPRLQAMQPRPRQVEWAVNQLVQGTLDQAFYPEGRDGWRTRVDMPQYTPSELVPLPDMAGGFPYTFIPPQILLGVAMTESNMQQAARNVVPGVTGNPLIGNYWGVTDSWDINFAEADCGYGIMQVTDGMEVGERPQSEQNAIAVDYVANIQAGAAILIEKWNQAYDAGMLIHNGDPRRIENWFYALWAYNSGFYPESDADLNNGAWGVGWHNNPANAKYPPNRHPFLNRNAFDDGRTPNLWPYAERAIGFAAWSSELIDGVGSTAVGFRAALWSLNEWKEGKWDADLNPPRWNYSMSPKPPLGLFCDDTNRCDENLIGDIYTPPGEPEVPGPCRSTAPGGSVHDFRCWYHEPAEWKEGCEPTPQTAGTCGQGAIRFPGVWSGDEDPYTAGTQTNPHSTSYDEEENQRSYAPNCSVTASSTTNSAPPNSWIVDDVPHGIPSVKKCARASSGGTFTWRFAQAANGTFPPKRDVHQIGAGWQGHFFFSHTRTGEAGGSGDQLRAAGTWRLGRSHNGWMRIAVHLPDHGAHTQQARYNIDLNGDGTADRHRYINQRRMANNWVSLGSYRVSGTPSVTLSNVTSDGDGTQDVAWDAVAFQPLSQEPVKVAVLGDSFTAGEGTGFAAATGAAGYYPENNIGADLDGYMVGGVERVSPWRNSCRRSPDAWSRKLAIPGVSFDRSGEAIDSWSSELELASVACSGARTVDLADAPWSLVPNVDWFSPVSEGRGWPQYGEVRQSQSGVLNSDTDFVLLNIGGNDGGLFTEIVKACLYGEQPSCAEEEPLVNARQFIEAHTIPRTEEVILDIQNRAPNATIVIATYPILFTPRSPELNACAANLGIGFREAAEITGVQLFHREKLRESIAVMHAQLGVDVHVALAEEYFTGHDACATPVAEQWINGLVPLSGRQGDGDAVFNLWSGTVVSMASVHPNDLGTVAYADAISCMLLRGIDEGSDACILDGQVSPQVSKFPVGRSELSRGTAP